MATKQAGGIEDVCVTISSHLCQLGKRKKILFCRLVISWVRRVSRIPPNMWSTLPTTLLRQAASLLGLVMLQTRVKNHPILLELLRAGSRKSLQQSQISPLKIGFVPGGFQQICFTCCHLLSFPPVIIPHVIIMLIPERWIKRSGLGPKHFVMHSALFTAALQSFIDLNCEKQPEEVMTLGLRVRKQPHYMTCWQVIPLLCVILKKQWACVARSLSDFWNYQITPVIV